MWPNKKAFWLGNTELRRPSYFLLDKLRICICKYKIQFVLDKIPDRYNQQLIPYKLHESQK